MARPKRRSRLFSTDTTFSEAKFPCPACRALRKSDRDRCHECNWPRSPSPRNRVYPGDLRPWWQFHLQSVFVCVTAACVILALHANLGFERFRDRLFAVSMLVLPFLPLVEFYCRWRKTERVEG